MQISGMDVDELRFEAIGSWPMPIRAVVLAIVLLILLYIGYSYYWTENLDTLSNLKTQEQTMQQGFVNLQQQIANLDTFNKQIIEVQQLLNTITRQLPKSPEEAGLLDDISQQASGANVQIKGIKPAPEQIQEFYGINTFEITIQGTYHTLGDFISRVSTIPRIITLHDFSVKPLKQNGVVGGGNLLTLVVIAKTYWYIPTDNKK